MPRPRAHALFIALLVSAAVVAGCLRGAPSSLLPERVEPAWPDVSGGPDDAGGYRTLIYGGSTGAYDGRDRVVLQDQAGWETFWASAQGQSRYDPPRVDWSRERVAVAYRSPDPGCGSLRITGAGVTATGDTWVSVTTYHRPGTCPDRSVGPVHVAAVPYEGGQVTFREGSKMGQPAPPLGEDAVRIGEIPLMLAWETYWLNSTSDKNLYADLGPHCEPVAYATPPPFIRYRAETQDPLDAPRPDGFLVRDIGRAGGSGDVSSFSGSRGLDALELPGGETIPLASPFDEERILAQVRLEGDAVWVDGERLDPGDKVALAFEYEVHEDGATYHVDEVLQVMNAGKAEAWATPPVACM